MPSGCLRERVAKGPVVCGSWGSSHCCNGCGVHSLPRVQLDMERKRKLITLDRISGRREEVVLKKPRVKCLRFCLMWTQIQKVCVPERAENQRGKAIIVAKSRYGRTGTAAGQSTGRVQQELGLILAGAEGLFHVDSATWGERSHYPSPKIRIQSL